MKNNQVRHTSKEVRHTYGHGERKFNVKDKYGAHFRMCGTLSTAVTLAYIEHIMDPNTSIERLCLGEDNRISLNDGVESNGEWDTSKYHDTTDSEKKKEAKAFTFYRMETEEISERYDAPCFVNDLEAYDGEINLEHDKNLISNEFAFIINPEEDDIEPRVVLGRSFLRLTKGIADFRNRIITIYPDLDPFNDVDSDKAIDLEDVWEVILEGIDFGGIPKSMGSSCHHMLNLDGEIEANKEEATKEVIKGYKTLREKEDQGVFILPIRLEANIDSFALAHISSNINVMPYQIYTKLGREDAKPIAKKITMLNHSMAEPMGILRDVLCQVGVTIILAKFLILDMPVDKDVPIVIGRSFLYTCGGIINTIKKTTSTFDERELELKESMVCYGRFVTKIAKRLGILTDEVLDGLSAPTYYRALDIFPLKELTGPNGRLIAEDQHLGAYAPPRYDEGSRMMRSSVGMT
ncbi:DNA-directed DNA polymerase [Tanacetum coccineum]